MGKNNYIVILNHSRMKKLSLHFLLFFFTPFLCLSQVDYDKIIKATDKVFVKDVIIHAKPGSIIEYGSILIEGGIITQIGKNLRIPTDAYILKADSLHAYPAFIDALSHSTIKKKENEERPKVKFKGSPPDDVAGITPGKSAFEDIDAESSDISTMRGLGFGISNIAPRGRMLPGQTAIISLSGKTKNEILLKENVALYSQLRTSSGVFPATMIGVLSKFKELYRQAEGAKIHLDKYSTSPVGMQRPSYSDAIVSMIPITQKKQTVYFKAESAKDVHRVLALKRALGFNLVLTDVKQIYPVIDQIKSLNVPVMVSLDLPEKPKGDKEDDQEKDKDKEGIKDDDEEEEELTDEEMEMLKKRKAEAYQEYVTQIAKLEEAGVQFGFSWIEAKPKKLQDNMMTLIENGLSEDAAIRGLTTVPAELLGISNIAGTAEKGKLANIILSTKPIFEKDSKIKFMLVEGEVFEYEIKKKKKKSNSGDEVDIAGTWDYEISQFGAAGTVIITKEDDSYKIEMTSDDDDDVMEGLNVSRDGNALAFDLKIEDEGFSMDVSVSIDFSEDEFEGNVNSDFGAAPIEGSKISPKL